MEKSKVYYSDLRALPGTNLLVKLQRLIRRAGIGEIDMENKMVAIKIHFGEPGNLSYLRPNYAKAVADVIKELGGRPFLTDCNTLYVGRRKNALDHIDAAYENGFTPFSTGCNVIIADGLKGTDDVEVRQIYKVSKVGTIAGCKVVDGHIKRDCKVRLIREGIVIYDGKLGSLRRFENDVKEVQNGFECGMTIENYNDIKVDDIIEAYEDQEV